MLTDDDALAISARGFAEMPARHDALVRTVGLVAVRSVWYTREALDPRPLYFHLSEYHGPPGREMKRVPRKLASGRVCSAFDIEGRVVRTQINAFTRLEPRPYYDTFFEYFSDGFAASYYSYDERTPIHYERHFADADLSAITATRGSTVRRFERDDRDRIAIVFESHGQGKAPVVPWARHDIVYDERGEIQTVWKTWSTGGRERTFATDA